MVVDRGDRQVIGYRRGNGEGTTRDKFEKNSVAEMYNFKVMRLQIGNRYKFKPLKRRSEG